MEAAWDPDRVTDWCFDNEDRQILNLFQAGIKGGKRRRVKSDIVKNTTNNNVCRVQQREGYNIMKVELLKELCKKPYSEVLNQLLNYFQKKRK